MTPLTHRLVSNHKKKGTVCVTQPVPEILEHMTGGGGYWDGSPRGFLDELVRRKTCPILQKGAPCKEEAARRFVKAMQYGGCSTQEAWAVIRDHDVDRFGECVEIVHVDDLPGDRWFRDAWRRSKNGGPVSIDLPKAQRIQWVKVKNAHAHHERTRELDLDLWRAPIDVPWLTIETAIRHARDEEELRRVWPDGLPHIPLRQAQA